METDGAANLDRGFIQDPNALYRVLRVQAPAHPAVMSRGRTSGVAGYPLSRSARPAG